MEELDHKYDLSIVIPKFKQSKRKEKSFQKSRSVLVSWNLDPACGNNAADIWIASFKRIVIDPQMLKSWRDS